MQKRGLVGTYNDLSALREQVLLHLTSVISKLLEDDREQPTPGERTTVLTAPVPDVRVLVHAVVVMPSRERQAFESGQSYDYMMNAKALLEKASLDLLDCVSVSDEVGRQYKSSTEDLRRAVMDAVRDEPAPTAR